MPSGTREQAIRSVPFDTTPHHGVCHEQDGQECGDRLLKFKKRYRGLIAKGYNCGRRSQNVVPESFKLENAMKRLYLALAGALALPAIASAQISSVNYGLLTGSQLVTFEDVAGGAAPGTNYDGIFFSNGVGFADRFVGQTLTNAGGFDQLGGAPSGGGLTLLAGAAGRNLNVFVNAGSQVLTGLGPLGFPSNEAIGEGSIAALFSSGQSQFGFQLVGGDGGSAFLSFFGIGGSLIQSITVNGLANAFYGFSRDGGVQDIYGISIWNTDGGGIGFDNLKFDVRSVGGTVVPEPTSFAMLTAGLGLICAAVVRRRRAKT